MFFEEKKLKYKNKEIGSIYLYKNLFFKENNKKFYPISLIFNEYSLSFLYTSHTYYKTTKIFEIPIGTGEINHQNTIKKIEEYWNKPSVDIEFLEKDVKEIYISPANVKIGFFTDLFQFDIKYGKGNGYEFKKFCYFSKEKRRDCKLKEHKVDYSITKLNSKLIEFSYKDRIIDIWSVNKNGEYIKTKNINFILIFLDFLYELIYKNTFNDKKAMHIKNILFDNPLIFTLTRKLEYLDELYQIRDKDIKKGADLKKSKSFLEKEKSWLNTLMDDRFYFLFTSSKSIFLNIESEIENVFFYSLIGKHNKHRIELIMEQAEDREDASHIDKYYDQYLKSEISSFFLRRFNIKNAFKSLFPFLGNSTHILVTIFLLFATFGDILIDKLFPSFKYFHFSILLPLLGFLFIIFWYAKNKINLFKLFLPRLFLGILIGWLSFAITADLWKNYIIKSPQKIVALDIVLLFIIFLFLFTTIRNRLKRVSDKEILKRTTFLVFFASVISIFQGFYVIQLEAREMLSVSGFFERDKFETKKVVCDISTLKKIESGSSPSIISEECSTLSKELYDNKILNSSVFTISRKYFEKEITFYYLWKILFSQFLVAMLIGIVLQILWEDRPITEPL